MDARNTCDIVQRNLAGTVPVHLIHSQFKQSAVLVPIIEGKAGAELVFTVRTPNVRKHKGEISFPGGAFEDNKDYSLKDTALRETKEEINISPDQVTVLGELDDFCTMTRYIIHPVVGYITPPYDFLLEEAEVSEIFTVPLDFFKDPANFEEKIMPIADWKYPIYYFKTGTHTIWGATAHIIVNFFEVALKHHMPTTLQQRPTPSQLLALLGKT